MRFTTLPILRLAILASVFAADAEHTPKNTNVILQVSLTVVLRRMALLTGSAQANLADCEVLLNSENDTAWKEK